MHAYTNNSMDETQKPMPMHICSIDNINISLHRSYYKCTAWVTVWNVNRYGKKFKYTPIPIMK